MFFYTPKIPGSERLITQVGHAHFARIMACQLNARKIIFGMGSQYRDKSHLLVGKLSWHGSCNQHLNFPNKASLESLLSNHLAQAGTNNNYNIYFDVILLLKAIHVQLLPVYLPFNLEKDNKCDSHSKSSVFINCKLFLYCLHVLLENQ